MRTGLLFATNRCELCPLRAASDAVRAEAQTETESGGRVAGCALPGTPDVHAASFEALARRILAYDARGA